MNRDRNNTPRLGVRDLLSETAAAMASRPGRTISTAIGTVLGVGAFVATLGLSATAANQVVVQLDNLVARQIVVRASAESDTAAVSDPAIPWDAEARLTRLNGVQSVGIVGNPNIGDRLSFTSPIIDPAETTEFALPVVATTPGFLAEIEAPLVSGRTFDIGHDQRADDVVVLGPDAARQLGITDVVHQPTIGIGDDRFSVIGILGPVPARPALAAAVVMPRQTAQAHYGVVPPTEVTITIDFGAGSLIAQQAPHALAPSRAAELSVVAPPDPVGTRQGIERETSALIFAMAGIALIVGALGIANTTLVSVLERTGEIGLRRSLGATRRHIAAHFLTESSLLGLMGGIVGTTLGLIGIVAFSAVRSWTPILDAQVLLISPPIGAVTGLLAGAYPAWQASRLEPVEALRH